MVGNRKSKVHDALGASSDNRSDLAYSTQPGSVNPSTTALSNVSWRAGSATAGTVFRLAVHLGATDVAGLASGWYVSNTTPNNAITTALTNMLANWSTASVLQTTAWQTTNWKPLTVANLNDVDPANDVGTAAALPGGNLTAFGLYVAGGSNYNPATADPDFAFDTYAIGVSSGGALKVRSPETAVFGAARPVSSAPTSSRRSSLFSVLEIGKPDRVDWALKSDATCVL